MNNVIKKSIAMSLWLLTAIIAGYQVFIARYLITNLYFLFLDRLSLPINVLERLSATGVGNIAALFMAIIAIVIVVGGFDYHWTRGGTKKSNKVLLWTFLFQIVVFGLYILT
jgi:hypothetical protein